MATNATATSVLNGTPVLIAGIWSAGQQSRFTVSTAGRITYIGTKAVLVEIGSTFAVTKSGGGTDSYIFNIGKNGTIIPEAVMTRTIAAGTEAALSIVSAISMSTGDFIELFVTGDGTTDNVTLQSANILAQGS
jgi:hypothetical protein